jgi:hypothetical protein
VSYVPFPFVCLAVVVHAGDVLDRVETVFMLAGQVSCCIHSKKFSEVSKGSEAHNASA